MSYPVEQEPEDVRGGPVWAVGVVSVVVTALAVFFGGLVVTLTAGSLRPDVIGRAGQARSTREISHVEQTLIWETRAGLDLRESQRRDLQSWGWADRGAGIARIPIEQAMDIVVQKEAK